MNDQQIQEIADRVILALQNLAPGEPSTLAYIAALAPGVALLAAIGAVWVGLRNLKQQQRALKVSVRSDARNLKQKREADARSEWWRRTQWALEATASESDEMYGYGTGMLSLLVKSELASPEDKALLYAVRQGTSTDMQEEGINQLVEEAFEQDDLTDEELASLRSFGDVVLSPREAHVDASDRDLAAEIERIERDVEALVGEMPKGFTIHIQADPEGARGNVTVDEPPVSGENEDRKDDDDAKTQDS